MGACGNPDLMQAPRGNAIGAVAIAHEMLKVQNDALGVVEIGGEGVQSFRVAALPIDRVANFGRKAVNVLRVVAILAAHSATFSPTTGRSATTRG